MIANSCPSHARKFTVEKTASGTIAYCAECGRYYGRVRDEQLAKLRQAGKIIPRKGPGK